MTLNVPVATIHLRHISENLQLVRTYSPSQKILAVVKANAYGHGLRQVMGTLSDADGFAVARVVEGVEARLIEPDKPIVVLEGFLDQDEVDLCVTHSLTSVIHSDYQLELLPADLPFWLKFNTGMFRLGFAPSRAEALSQQVGDLKLQGIMTHFANADTPVHPANEVQLASFETCAAAFPNAAQCLANSGGIVGLGQSHKDWVRPGLMLYGGSPSTAPSTELKAGMSLSAPIIAINDLAKGDAVGYGSHWVTSKPCRVAVVAMGYADGYPREISLDAKVLVGGKKRALVGRVSMDMCTVLLQDEDNPKPGDHVTFWGPALPIDLVASWAETLSYTLMAGIGHRVQRKFDFG